jgi:Methylase involved in ubiquinone/menaquinone biosynthesis
MKLTKYIGEQFGNPTGIGGKLSTFIMNRMNQKQYRAVMRAIDIRPDETVLDIGFGNGYLIGKLAKSAADSSFRGIDISDDMLRGATKRNRKFVDQGKMQLQTGDVCKMTYADSTFDKVYTVNTIYFWQDIDAALTEIRRTLKPNGIFINAMYTREFLNSLRYTDYGFTKLTEPEFREAVTRNGFKIKETTEIKKNVSNCYVLEKQ